MNIKILGEILYGAVKEFGLKVEYKVGLVVPTIPERDNGDYTDGDIEIITDPYEFDIYELSQYDVIQYIIILKIEAREHYEEFCKLLTNHFMLHKWCGLSSKGEIYIPVAQLYNDVEEEEL